MFRFICDTPDRVPARIFAALGTSCPCCAFWRGALLGFCGALVVASIVVLIHEGLKL